jgi:uncharacterized membrane protein YeaQ/YmgE (transglycosylase-associated protein family)
VTAQDALPDVAGFADAAQAGTVGVMHWIWLIIVGAVVGALGRLFHPGTDPMGWIVTILIGIASLVIAGVIFSNGILQFVVGIIVAVILVALVGRFFGGRRTLTT